MTTTRPTTTAVDSARLTHLQRLEAESIHDLPRGGRRVRATGDALLDRQGQRR